MMKLSREDAERMLIEWSTVNRDRDIRVRAAVAAGLSKYRIHQLTGIGRMTIDRILADEGHVPDTDPGEGSRS